MKSSVVQAVIPPAEYQPVDLSEFDRSDDAYLSHWRGFTKFRQPDGTTWALCEISAKDGKPIGWALGPCKDGRCADDEIVKFHTQRS